MLDNCIHVIEKEGTRLKAKTEHTIDTFKFTIYNLYKIQDSNKISLNGQDRIDTFKTIKGLIGEYDDFCISSICLQNNYKNKYDFYTMSSTDRKNFLNNKFNCGIDS